MVRRSIWIAVGIVISLSLLSNCFTVIKVYGKSMEPTVKTNSLLIVFKIMDNPVINVLRKYGKKHYPNFENKIIVFTREEKSKPLLHKTLVKRCIALPGDSISVQSGRISINGDNTQEGIKNPLQDSVQKFTLEYDQLFVIGDNFKASLDSRHFGPIRTESIIGIGLLTVCNGHLSSCN